MPSDRRSASGYQVRYIQHHTEMNTVPIKSKNDVIKPVIKYVKGIGDALQLESKCPALAFIKKKKKTTTLILSMPLQFKI